MSTLAASWTAQQWRICLTTGLCWWGGAAIGGALSGLLLRPHAAIPASACTVALFQALTFRADPRFGTAWFGATTVAGALGFGATVVGGTAFAEVAGHELPLSGQAAAAWIVLSALGGLLLAAAQAPLTGPRKLAWAWRILGLFAGGVLWPPASSWVIGLDRSWREDWLRSTRKVPRSRPRSSRQLPSPPPGFSTRCPLG